MKLMMIEYDHDLCGISSLIEELSVNQTIADELKSYILWFQLKTGMID